MSDNSFHVRSVAGSANVYVATADGSIFADAGIIQLCASAAEADALTLKNVENAKRIAACLNACASIPDLALKPGIVFEMATETQQLIRKVDHFEGLAAHRSRSINNLMNINGKQSTEIERLTSERDQLQQALEMLILFTKPAKSNAVALANAHTVIAAVKGGA